MPLLLLLATNNSSSDYSQTGLAALALAKTLESLEDSICLYCGQESIDEPSSVTSKVNAFHSPTSSFLTCLTPQLLASQNELLDANLTSWAKKNKTKHGLLV